MPRPASSTAAAVKAFAAETCDTGARFIAVDGTAEPACRALRKSRHARPRRTAPSPRSGHAAAASDAEDFLSIKRGVSRASPSRRPACAPGVPPTLAAAAMSYELTVFQGRVGDHNDLGIPGARSLGRALRERLGVEPSFVGSPRPAMNLRWDAELEAARPELVQLQARLESLYARGGRALSATSRCAASIATLPVVARHHPEACVVWFDAHADLNTPQSTTSGYLGGLALSASLGLWESGFGSGLALTNIVLVGQRDIDPFEQALIRAHRLPLIRPGARMAEELRAAIAGRPAYVHLDCDVLNPGIVPTDYVHEGGLCLDDLKRAMQVLAEHPVVGVELAEYQDAWAPGAAPVSPAPLLDALAPVLEAPARHAATASQLPPR